jgi:hypothetical protein
VEYVKRFIERSSLSRCYPGVINDYNIININSICTSKRGRKTRWGERCRRQKRERGKNSSRQQMYFI